MPDTALILRRTLTERQLIGGEVQKTPKNSLIREPWLLISGLRALQTRHSDLFKTAAPQRIN
jgi:hypothetical protein